MSDQPDDESTQTTEKGLKIPVPTREGFMRNLDKVAPPAKREKPDPEPSEGRSADE